MRIRGWARRPAFAICACLLATTASATPFDATSSYPVGTFPSRVTLGDLDGDGLADVVASNSISQDLSVLMNQGGNLGPENRIDPGGEPRQVVIADVDSDGDRDLVVALRLGSGLISVLKNDGSGTFAPAIPYGVADLTFSLKLADVDADGDLDALTIGAVIDSTQLTVLVNDGNGAFSVFGIHPAAAADVVYVADLDVADVNLDGLPDVATTLLNSDAVTVLINGGGGDFLPAVAVDLGQVGPTAVLLRDVNRDGAPDLLVMDTCFGGDELRIGLNDGTGQFTLWQVELLAGPCNSFTNPTGLAAGYFDGDTAIDLAYASYGTDSIRLLLNQGDGTFVAGDAIATDPGPLAVAVGDIDGTGSDDILSGNRTEVRTADSITVSLNDQCAPLFSQLVLADHDGIFWASALPFLGVRGSFTAVTGVSEFDVDRQFTATGSRLDDPDLPVAGEGFWYLVRPTCTGASWTSNGPTEVTGRDALLP